MNVLTSLCVPIKSSLLVCEKIISAYNALFEVPAKRKGQKPILFGRIETEPVACESSGDNSGSLQFFHYGQKSRHMMERMGYDFTKESGLTFGKEKRALLRSFVPKGKDLITTTRPEGELVIYLRQSHQISSLKKRSIMIAHQQRCHGTQISVSIISSKHSQ